MSDTTLNPFATTDTTTVFGKVVKPKQGWTYRIEVASTNITNDQTWITRLNNRGLRRSSARVVKQELVKTFGQRNVRIVREQDGKVIW